MYAPQALMFAGHNSINTKHIYNEENSKFLRSYVTGCV